MRQLAITFRKGTSTYRLTMNDDATIRLETTRTLYDGEGTAIALRDHDEPLPGESQHETIDCAMRVALMAQCTAWLEQIGELPYIDVRPTDAALAQRMAGAGIAAIEFTDCGDRYALSFDNANVLIRRNEETAYEGPARDLVQNGKYHALSVGAKLAIDIDTVPRENIGQCIDRYVDGCTAPVS